MEGLDADVGRGVVNVNGNDVFSSEWIFDSLHECSYTSATYRILISK